MDRVVLYFPGGKSKAFTLSYDDGTIYDEKLLSMCRAHGVKGTFNLNSGRLGMEEYLTSEQVRTLYTPDVAEVATHGKVHAFLTQLPAPAAALELLEDRLALEQLTDRIVRGHAYPYGAVNDATLEVLRLAGIAYARTVNSTHRFQLPENWLRWDPTCHHDDPKLPELIDQFLKLPPFVSPAVFYVWGHSYEFGRPSDWRVMEQLLDKVSGNDGIWYATNMEIHDYVEAFRSLIWSAGCKMVFNPTSTTVWFGTTQWPERSVNAYCIEPGETICVG